MSSIYLNNDGRGFLSILYLPIFPGVHPGFAYFFYTYNGQKGAKFQPNKLTTMLQACPVLLYIAKMFRIRTRAAKMQMT